MNQKFMIGGEFELDVATSGKGGSRNLLNKFSNYSLAMSGRVGIKLILRSLKRKKRFLLPSYLCDSVIQPFRQENLEYQFYPVKSNLEIDIERLNLIVNKFKPDGILFINYFGFPVSQKVKEFFKNIGNKITIIEDCSHGSLIETDNPIIGDTGHFIVSSFRKYLSLPDGALVISKKAKKLPQLKSYISDFFKKRYLAKIIRNEYINNRQDYLEKIYLNLFLEAEEFLNNSEDIVSISEYSKNVLNTLNFSTIIKKRRKNFSFLVNEFSKNDKLKKVGTPLYNELSSKVSPFMFPIRVFKNRNILQKELRKNNIFCPILWPIPHVQRLSDYKDSINLSSDILCLPIDQRYSIDQMKFIIQKIIQIFKK